MGRTYFIRSGGNDANNGLSEVDAWATFGKYTSFQNGGSALPGDTFQFADSDTFSCSSTEGLFPTVSGTAGNPITTRSYGGTGRATINSTGVVGGTLACERPYFTFQDLILTGAGKGLTVVDSSGVQLLPGSHHCIVKNLAVSAFDDIGVQVEDESTVVDGCTIHDVGAHGILAGAGSTSLEVKNSEVYAWGGNPTWESGGRHGIYAECYLGRIHNNTFRDPDIGVSGQATSIRKSHIRVYNNLIHDVPNAAAFFNYDDTSVDNQDPGFLWFYCNLLYNITGWGFYIDGESPAPRVGGPGIYQNTVDIAIANNTMHFDHSTDWAITQDAVNVDSDASTRIFNNIITGTPWRYLQVAAPTLPGKSLVVQNNCWFGATQTNPWEVDGVSYNSFGGYQGSGLGLHDMNQNPQIAAPPSLVPNSGSPVIDAGSTQSEPGGLVYTHV